MNKVTKVNKKINSSKLSRTETTTETNTEPPGFTYIYQLEELQDILNDFGYDDVPSSLCESMSEEEIADIINTMVQLMYDYTCENADNIHEPDFHEEMMEAVGDLLVDSLGGLDAENELERDDNVDAIWDLFEQATEVFYTQIMPKRSYHSSYMGELPGHLVSSNETKISTRLSELKSMPQPEQRTPEWYIYRHGLITASNAHKMFDTQSMQNQLIYEKCKPLNLEVFIGDGSDNDNTDEEYPNSGKNKGTPLSAFGTLDIVKSAKTEEDLHMIETARLAVNITSPLHWGQKYEPVTCAYYEQIYDTTVGEYGCIRHATYTFLGASPDGIVDDIKSDRFGRMVEIKNIVNREITGIPLKAYWVQMQLQMEVCDLDACDFMETRFKEYVDEEAFREDGTFLESVEGKLKGIMVCFLDKENMPVYEYKPLRMDDKEYTEQWLPNVLIQHAERGHHRIHTYYWWLEEVSCVVVLRNKIWFEMNIEKMQAFWDTIVKERKTGYAHRAPKKVNRQTNDMVFQQCLLNIHEDGTTGLVGEQEQKIVEVNIVSQINEENKKKMREKDNLNIEPCLDLNQDQDSDMEMETNSTNSIDKLVHEGSGDVNLVNSSDASNKCAPVIMHIRTQSIDETVV